MRFGSRSALGVSPGQAQRRLNPSSLWLPRVVDTGPLASSARTSVNVTASATPHTKGAWATIIATTADDSTWVNVHLVGPSGVSGADTSTLIDIGVGAAASEVVIAANVPIGYLAAGMAFSVPVKIPKGVRVAARIQSLVVSKIVAVQIDLSSIPYGPPVSASTSTYGADTATSRGTALAVPGAINTKGAWTELTSATTVGLQALTVSAQAGGTTVAVAAGYLVDIGIGGSGSEVVVSGLADMYYTISSAELLTNYSAGQPVPVNIPVGSRIAARYQTANLTDLMDLAVVGIPR